MGLIAVPELVRAGSSPGSRAGSCGGLSGGREGSGFLISEDEEEEEGEEGDEGRQRMDVDGEAETGAGGGMGGLSAGRCGHQRAPSLSSSRPSIGRKHVKAARFSVRSLSQEELDAAISQSTGGAQVGGGSA